MKSRLPLLLATAALPLLAGCGAPLVLGAAASAGVIGLQSRPSSQVAQDTAIKTRIKGYLSDKDFRYLGDVGIDVFYNDVLVTGVLPSEKDGEQVMSVVKATQGVNKVYNELFIGDVYTTKLQASDAWITAQIKPRLLGTKGIYPLNYLITVVNGHVYAFGSCATAVEHTHLLHILRTTKGVQEVHDYLRIDGSEAADGRSNTLTAEEGILGTGKSGAPAPLPPTNE